MKFTRTHRLIAVAAALVFVLIVVAIIVSFPTDRDPTARFKDGTEVTLLGVGYEKTNTFLYGSDWRKFLYRILPPTMKSKAGLSTMTAQTWTTNSPAFFARIYNPNGIKTEISRSKVFVFDEYGVEFAGNGGGEGSHHVSEKEIYRYWYKDIYGPCSSIAGLRLYHGDGPAASTVNLMIPGHVVKKPAVKQINLSAQKSSGREGLDVRLMSFTTGWKRLPDPFRPKLSPYYSQICFVVSTNGVPTHEFLPDVFQIAPVGKKRSAIQRMFGQRGDETVVNFQTDINPTNRYQVRLGLMRQSGFKADETCVFDDVPFPDRGEVITTNAAVEIQGTRLILERIGSAGTSGRGDQPASSYVQVRFSPPVQGLNLWIEDAKDEMGKSIPTAGYGLGDNGSSFHWFQPNVEAKKMRLTFVVHKTYFFDFEVQPVVVTERGL